MYLAHFSFVKAWEPFLSYNKFDGLFVVSFGIYRIENAPMIKGTEDVMLGNELIHSRNIILFLLICCFYFVQVAINIFIEGFASVFPPAFLFMALGIIMALFIYRKINPKFTMYVMISCMYIYFYFLLNDSPYLVNYLFMWLGLPLCAIYQNKRMVLVAGMASIILTFYSFFYLHEEIFPNVVREDFVYLVLFNVITATFLLIFVQKIREANVKLQELAYYDSLTGAANRLLLKERFNLLKTTKIHSLGLLFIDMNGFKKINDTYGHEVGDLLLVEIVSRLNCVLQDKDLLCRLGGDEFVILNSSVDNQKLEKIANNIQLVLELPINLNHQIINVSASIGWYFTTDILSADLDSMIKEADRAMYKEKGNELVVSHSPEIIQV